jgi:hypothetical protein
MAVGLMVLLVAESQQEIIKIKTAQSGTQLPVNTIAPYGGHTF